MTIQVNYVGNQAILVIPRQAAQMRAVLGNQLNPIYLQP